MEPSVINTSTSLSNTHISWTQIWWWYSIKAHISHATASCPDYKVHAVHFCEHDDAFPQDDKCPHM